MSLRALSVPALLLMLAACEGEPPAHPHILSDRQELEVSAWLGTSVGRSLALQNEGLEDLVLESVALSPSGGPFTFQGPDKTVVEPLQRAFLTVYFQPTAAGEVTAQLTIGSNAENEPSLVIPLVGTGVCTQQQLDEGACPQL